MTDTQVDLSSVDLKSFLALISGQDNNLHIPRWLLQITGNDFPAALMANQLLYWYPRIPESNDGWIHKSAKDWKAEIELSSYQVGRAAKKLREVGFPLETRKKKSQYYKGAPTMQYKVDAEKLVDFVKLVFQEPLKSSSNDIEKPIQRVRTEKKEKELSEPSPEAVSSDLDDGKCGKCGTTLTYNTPNNWDEVHNPPKDNLYKIHCETCAKDTPLSDMTPAELDAVKAGVEEPLTPSNSLDNAPLVTGGGMVLTSG